MKSRNAKLIAEATSLHRAGRLDEAERLYRSVLSADPDHVEVLTALGTIHFQRGHWEEGLRLIGLSLEIRPQQPIALNNRGNALKELKRYSEALENYELAIAFSPDYAEAYSNRGNVLVRLDRFAEALASYDRAIALNPHFAPAYNNRADALYGLKRFAEALASCDRAIALNPRLAPAYSNRGNALNGLKRCAEALASCDRAIALNPGFAPAYNNRGNALNELKRFDEALASFDKAIGLSPDYAEAHCNRANTLSILLRLDDALASYDKAIALNPDLVMAYNNRGNLLVKLKRPDDALASYDKAIALNPDLVEALWNKALFKLLIGDYAEGWALYEWRWKRDEAAELPRDFPQPLWRGQESLTGKTVLLHAEQGLGDSIQFCRYVPMVEALGARVVLEIQPPLLGLMSTLKGSARVISQGDILPGFDCYCPLMSLPLAFKTIVSTIPAQAPYLAVDPGKQEQWKKCLGAKTRPRVGLVWSGTPGHKNDRNRSIPLDRLSPLLGLDFEFHCLQKEVRPPDRDSLERRHQKIRTYESDLNDFSDTAALIMEMDLVVSVDTSVAHLAGALGQRVWVLLPFPPDFRWLMDGELSPWYPSARLFRQEKVGDWEGVIEQVVAALNAFC